MSTFIDYFFNSDKSLYELSDEINACLGTNLVVSRPHRKEQAGCMFFGMFMDFWEHTEPEEDLLDLQIKFRYQIGLVSAWYFREIRTPLLGLVAYTMYRRMDIGSGAIVRELAEPLAMYETRIFEADGESYENLFDTISGKEVEMPLHLKDLASLKVE